MAAVRLGHLDSPRGPAQLSAVFPPARALEELIAGELDLVAASAHAPFAIDPDLSELVLLATLSRHTYWFLVLRSDIGVTAERIGELRDVRIGAAPGPDAALRRLFADAGVDVDAAGISIAPVPPPVARPDGGRGPVSFGVAAVDALAVGGVDGFWANGMAAEIAVRRGHGRVVVDARRGGEPVRSYTFAALIGARRLVEDQPDAAVAAVRGVRRAQRALTADPAIATGVATDLFPPTEAGLIGALVRRDAPFYDPRITPEDVTSLTGFAAAAGLVTDEPTYDRVVPVAVRDAWVDNY